MKRPIISELAKEAGVSISTVNRILSGSSNVRGITVQRVQSAAERIGFYGVGAIEDRLRKSAPHYRLGFLLQQSTRELYQIFAKEITAACRARPLEVIDPVIDFVDTLTPDNISKRLFDLGQSCDAVAVIAADHPQIGHTIRELHDQGTPVITYITDQSAPERAAFVGTDNWKIGRTAAWIMDQTIHKPGRIAIYLGNHRYQCQDMADASFRSYLREKSTDLVIEDSRPTLEEADSAYEMVQDLLRTTEDLSGIFIVGGGISGVLRALRETSAQRRQNIKVICRDIGPETRKGLTEGLITAALCHPLEATSQLLVQAMVDAITDETGKTAIQYTLPFEIITPENI